MSTNPVQHPVARRRAPSAFTLLELLVALSIFGIASLAILTVMRNGLRAWNTGHGMSELLQSVRVTQDVMLKDLNNMVYRGDGVYNQSFDNQLMRLSDDYRNSEDPTLFDPNVNLFESPRDKRDRQRERRRRERREREGEAAAAEGSGEGEGDDSNLLTPQTIAPPIDLSFQGEDSGEADRLVFARAHHPTLPDDPRTWGIRRVSFYVENKTLYRKEEDPYGYRPSEMKWRTMGMDPVYLQMLALYLPEEEFQKENGIVQRMGESGFDPDLAAALRQDHLSYAPRKVTYAEPLCDNVEVFDIAFGYFQDGEWIEVEDWDSGASRYRYPPEEEDEFNDSGYWNAGGRNDRGSSRRNRGDRIDRNENQRNPAGSIDSTLGMPARVTPDDLPGYISIQLGVRLPGGRGRIRSFSFYQMLAQGQETDIVDPEYDDDERSRMRQRPDRPPPRVRHAREEKRAGQINPSPRQRAGQPNPPPRQARYRSERRSVAP